MSERDELVAQLRGWDHCWPAPWLEGAVQDAADRIERDRREIERLREALTVLLRRDEINTCQHEETYRGGFLWEICLSCGANWTDDEGGRPEWREPPEWILARAALNKDTNQ